MAWSVVDSRKAYGLDGWSSGYFDIDEATGTVFVCPYLNEEKGRLSLQEILQDTADNQLKYPLLIRFLDIITHRVHAITDAFEQAMQSSHSHSHYRAMYPVKVNQQRDVVEAVMSGGAGLEVGTKAELLAALSYASHAQYGENLTIICNGYKDREYIRLALVAHAMGADIFIVIEKLAEYTLFCEESEKLNLGNTADVQLGVRVRLSSIAAGRWQNSGGRKSKFGLSSQDLLHLINRLEEQGHTLKLLHAHMGSQIARLADIETGIGELARFYCELHKMGQPIEIIDMGGGLAVDYDGTASQAEFSKEYTLAAYAEAVVRAIQAALVDQQWPFPLLYGEPGRALVAYHAMLVTNIVNVEVHHEQSLSMELSDEKCSPYLSKMQQIYTECGVRPLTESYQQLQASLEKIYAEFSSGAVSLAEQAQAEAIFFRTCDTLLNRLDRNDEDEKKVFDKIKTQQADKCFCNFSLFQSLPDIWGLGQIFPILPLQNLQQPLERTVRVLDMTCDSDGQVDHYVGQGNTLPLANENSKVGALVGMFLLGAYQETLGDMHNLFGRPDTVNVILDQDKGYLHHIRKGEQVVDVLEIVGYDENKLMAALEHCKCASSLMSKHESREIFRTALRASTYLSQR